MNQWNVELYEQKHSYVWEYGANLTSRLGSPTSVLRRMEQSVLG